MGKNWCQDLIKRELDKIVKKMLGDNMATKDTLGLVPQNSDLAEQLKSQYLYPTPYADMATGVNATTNTMSGLMPVGTKIPEYMTPEFANKMPVLGGTEVTPGLGQWFTDNKAMLGAGLGLGQLGLGFLNYQANKEGLESDLATAEQARRLNEERAQNKRDITSKAQAALRWGV